MTHGRRLLLALLALGFAVATTESPGNRTVPGSMTGCLAGWYLRDMAEGYAGADPGLAFSRSGGGTTYRSRIAFPTPT